MSAVDVVWVLAFGSPLLGLVGLVLLGMAVGQLGRQRMRLRMGRIALLTLLYVVAVLGAGPVVGLLLFFYIEGLLLFAGAAGLGLAAVLLGVLVYVAARRGRIPDWLF